LILEHHRPLHRTSTLKLENSAVATLVMQTIEDLFDNDILAPYLPLFLELGYEDLAFLLEMDSSEWETVLDTVEQLAFQKGMNPKPGHRMMIVARLTKEKVRRGKVSRRQDSFGSTSLFHTVHTLTYTHATTHAHTHTHTHTPRTHRLADHCLLCI